MTDLGLAALVWAPEQIKKSRVELLVSSTGPGRDTQRFGPVVVFEFLQFRGNFIQCLIPGDCLPLVAPLFANPLKRVIDALRMVESLQIRTVLPGTGFNLRSSDLKEPTVFNLDLQTASRLAPKTD